jgi:hypothetical protein
VKARTLIPLLLAVCVVPASCRRGDAGRQRRIEALEVTRNELQERLAELQGRDPVIGSAPEGDVLVALPESTAAGLLRSAVTGFLDHVEVVLGPIRVHKQGVVKARTFLGTITAGDYVLDVRLDEARGLLEPGEPKLDFTGQRVDVAVPVRIVKGTGSAAIRFNWTSRGIAGAFCEDFEVTTPVTGSVVPTEYRVKGAFDLTMADGTLTALPRFPDLKINVKVAPSARSWQAVDDVLTQRSAKCRTALGLVHPRRALRRLLDKGFNVKIPQRIFKPIQLPAGFQQTVVVEGKSYGLLVQPRALKLTERLLWYAADITGGAPEGPPAVK